MHYEVKNKEINLPAVNLIHKELSLPLLIAGLISARKLNTVDSVMDYLEPGSKLFNPFELKGMDKAVTRILEAIAAKEQIYICGDYDVDGITSTAILLRFFTSIGYPICYNLPTQTEGHGLSVESVKKIKDLGGSLIVTVDNGSTSYEAVDLANELKVDVIITDHHDISNQGVPNALAVINPKQADCKSSFKYLSGGGLALYLARGLASKIEGGENKLTHDLIVLASISTVADVAPLTGDNRKIVKIGLNSFFKSEILGLKLLLEKESSGHDFGSRDIAFKVAPKINAAGKFGYGDDAIRLLTETNYLQVSGILKKILELNAGRKDLVAGILPDLIKQGKECVDRGDQVVIVHSSHRSAVNGLVASKLVEQFHKPAIVISFDENGEGRASCRSVDGFNIQEAIETLLEHHQGGGGHYMAAGLSIQKTQLDGFRVAINKYAEEAIKNKAAKFWTIDAEVSASFLDNQTMNCLKMMEPFGAKNETPFLKIRGVKIQKDTSSRWVSYNTALGEYFVKVYKNLENTMEEIPTDKLINVIGELTSENGNPLLVIKDYELAE